MPDKDDYWSNERWLPLHEVCTVNGMTRNRFRFIWRNFHLNHEEDSGIGDNDNSDSNEDDEEDDLLVEIGMERVEVDQENELEEANGGAADDEDDEDGDTLTKKKDVWFDKIAYFVDHFRDVSESLIFTLGTLLAIDEMIIRFTGRSAETHRIKNKPIGEGYKFFVLTTFFGFIVNFTPDGRKAAREDTLEYTNESGMGKVESMIMYVLNVIHRLKKKQRERFLKKKPKQTRRRTNTEGVDNEAVLQDQFIVAMDNYFTMPKIIHKLREQGIGIVGTSRFRRNFPPKDLKEVSDEKSNFNDFYWMIDEGKTLLGRWKDNGMVFVTSTIHKVGNIIKRMRKKPRITANNKKHVKRNANSLEIMEALYKIIIAID